MANYSKQHTLPSTRDEWEEAEFWREVDWVEETRKETVLALGLAMYEDRDGFEVDYRKWQFTEFGKFRRRFYQRAGLPCGLHFYDHRFDFESMRYDPDGEEG